MSTGGAAHAQCKAARIHRFQSNSGLIQPQKGSSLFVSVSASGSKQEVMKEASRAGHEPETALIQHLCSACVSAPPAVVFFFNMFLYPVGLHASSTTTATQPHPEAAFRSSDLSFRMLRRLSSESRPDWSSGPTMWLAETPVSHAHTRNRSLRLKFPFNYCYIYFFFSLQLMRFA